MYGNRGQVYAHELSIGKKNFPVGQVKVTSVKSWVLTEIIAKNARSNTGFHAGKKTAGILKDSGRWFEALV